MTGSAVDAKASFTLRGHNPDVLTCIANLSNDEVFTPPELANQMLDTLEQAWAESRGGASIWSNPAATFLDPFTKSGVFLREITRRLTIGLENEIPDLAERVDHILTKQVYGIGITQLTALLARRSVYCSKDVTGEHSIAKNFNRDWGNIWFERTEHTWVGRARERQVTALTGEEELVEVVGTGNCRFCGASEAEYGRTLELETHAYAFIHTNDIKARVAELFGADMQFDVIIGNPPYQLSDGGYGTSAAPIYHDFVDRAKELDPRHLSLVIPSRWYAGGKGLDAFRVSMLTDKRLRVIHDFWQVGDAFPGVALQGGVLYFLWSRDDPGDCEVVTHYEGKVLSESRRPLLEPGADVFIRYNEAVSILRKIVEIEGGEPGSAQLPVGARFSALVSSRKPFGLDTKFRVRSNRREGDLLTYWNGGPGYKQGGRGWVSKDEVSAGSDLIDHWKVFIGGAYGDRGGGGASRDAPPKAVLGRPFVGAPGSISTETYICIGPFPSEREAENVTSYIACKLTRFLVMLHKPSQHATQKVYTFVPCQDFSRSWTDAELYERYGLSDDEIAFVEWMIRPMELIDRAASEEVVDA
jgi:Eco57I restriction endonuclease.